MIVAVDGLTITAGAEPVLTAAALHLPRGSITALTGPSGAGKSTLLRAVLGDVAPGLARTAGTVSVLGQDTLAMTPKQLQAFRREHLAYVGQDPGAALNPVMRVRGLLSEVARDVSAARLEEVLADLRLPASYLGRRAGQLSGGEQRRAALARALVRDTDVLLLDEPLAGLDAPLRRHVTAVLRRLATDREVAVVISGHDNGVLTELADQVVSVGVLPAPRPVPVREPARADADAAVLVRAEALGTRTGPVLHDVDFTIGEGAATAVIGASGAGKTTLARVLTGLQPHTGRLDLAGELLHRLARRRGRAQRRRIQLIPQDPLSTLNPRHTVGTTIARPLALHGRAPAAERPGLVENLLAEVGLPADLAGRHPHELSGGQRQRVAIARALAAGPDLLICDEITSALDAENAANIMDLLDRLRAAHGLALLVISHDLALVARHCDHVLVIHDGNLVEQGRLAEVVAAPAHPITAALIEAAPATSGRP